MNWASFILGMSVGFLSIAFIETIIRIVRRRRLSNPDDKRSTGKVGKELYQ